MGNHTKTSGLLGGPRRRIARRKLADQIRATAIPYQALSDQEAIDLFLEQETMCYRLDLSLHETAILLGDETEADRPDMSLLLKQAVKYECQSTPRAVYAAQLLITTVENQLLKLELEAKEAEVTKLKATIELLNPQHLIRLN